MTSILIKIAAAMALLAVLLFGEQYVESRGYDRAAAQYTAQYNKLKAEAGALLAQETQKNRAAEQALQAQANAQNRKDADHAKTLSALNHRLDAYLGPGLRLRDPHATAGCGAGGGGTPGDPASATAAGAADRAEAGGLLSAELTELLQHLAREADAINVAYASCRADAYTVRAALP